MLESGDSSQAERGSEGAGRRGCADFCQLTTNGYFSHLVEETHHKSLSTGSGGEG